MTVEREEEDISLKRRNWGGFFSWIPDLVRNDTSKTRVKTTLTDEAGHVTDIAFTEERKFGTSFTLSDFSVTRDGVALDASRAYASYDAIPGRWGRDYASLVSSLRTGSEAMLSWYDGWRDMTWITSFLPGEGILQEREPGMIVPVFRIGDDGVEIIVE